MPACPRLAGRARALLFFPPRPPASQRPSCNQPTTQRWSACWLSVRLKHTPSPAPAVVFWFAGRSGGCVRPAFLCHDPRRWASETSPLPLPKTTWAPFALHAREMGIASLPRPPRQMWIRSMMNNGGAGFGMASCPERTHFRPPGCLDAQQPAAARPNRTRSTTKHAETRAVMVMILSNKKKHVVHFIFRPAPSSNSVSCYRYASTARRKCTTRGRRQRVTVYPVPKTTKKQNKKKHHDRANNHRDTHHPTLLFPRSEPILCDPVCAPR